MKHSLKLTEAEKEIITLKAAWSAIHEMVNYDIMNINHSNPNSSVTFKTSSNQKYFGILLLDFLNSRIFGIGKNCMDALNDVIENPIFNKQNNTLSNSLHDFKTWLESDVQLECDGETTNFWFPSIEKDIALQIKRIEFLRICGNISKHNVFTLDQQANTILEIFSRNQIKIEVTQSLLIVI